MGHRALVAYERTDGTYNLHYTHWGGSNLRLKHTITEATPFGGDTPAQWAREAHQALTTGSDPETVRDSYTIDGSCPTDVEPIPRETGVTLTEILTAHLDYLHHEAFYVVDRELEVTAYRTLWFGLQYDADSIDRQPTVGFGAVRTVRWYEGEPVGDGRARGEFAGMKRVVGAMVDRGVFDEQSATQFLKQQVQATTDTDRGMLFGAID
ncbi:DUF6735 family protein [Halorarius halobius]|uniref:DUF6735 family protein n=1 Tax=Halorarius halobius TaxID=2962671 RepID=UPI0020CC700E|nr:DUF6735 family protein [Halorarius halobius]